MFVLMIIWCILLFECFSFGVFIKELIGKYTESDHKAHAFDLFYIVLIGFVSINTLVQVICLFTNIGIYVQALFFVAALFLLYFQRKKAKEILFTFWLEKPIGFVSLFVIFLIAALLWSSCPTFTDDTYGYHAQTVRWIEEIGTVKGIANIHMRLGYNSSVFAISALYGFAELFQQSVRSINGFFILLSGSMAIFHIMDIKKCKYFWGTGIAFSILYYSYCIRKEISGLDNCTFSIMLALIILFCWCRILEGLDDRGHLFWLTLFIVYLATVKMNLAPLGLLCALFLLKEIISCKKYREVSVWLICVFMISGVWMVRNYFVSGYLIYPFYKIDLFSVDWKVPTEVAANDYNWIIAWARTGTRGLDTALNGVSWIPIWFSDLWNRSHILCMAVVLTPLCAIFTICYMLKKKRNAAYLPIVLSIAYFCWLFSAPSARFGLGWILALYAMAFGCIMDWMRCKNNYYITDKAICLLLICMVEFWTVQAVIYADVSDQIGRQIDYNDDQFQYGYLDFSDDVRVWFPVMDEHSNGHAGYWNFPATNEYWTLSHLEPRGDSLKDGFRTNYNLNNF